MDTFKLKWYSSTLFAFNEPTLFNYYQGHDIYRFLWLRSFDAPIVISLHKNDDEAWLTVKKLDRQPKFIDMYEPYTITNDPEDTLQISTATTHHLVKADRVANIVLDEKKVLSEAEWDKFDSLLSACQFRKLSPSIYSRGVDGSEWIIEAHLRDSY